MKKKLLFCTIVALLLSATAFASGSRPSTTISVLCNLPEIQVTVPSTGEIYFNPFQLPVEIDGESVSEPILSEPMSIENKSEVPLSITVSVTGTIKEGSNMRLATSSTKDLGLSSKRAFVYFEMQAVADPDQVVWDGEYDEAKHIIVRTATKTKKNLAIIAQANQPKQFGAFRLTGDCVPYPKYPWTEADGIDVEIAFTFKPLSVATEIP